MRSSMRRRGRGHPHLLSGRGSFHDDGRRCVRTVTTIGAHDSKVLSTTQRQGSAETRINGRWGKGDASG